MNEINREHPVVQSLVEALDRLQAAERELGRILLAMENPADALARAELPAANDSVRRAEIAVQCRAASLAAVAGWWPAS